MIRSLNHEYVHALDGRYNKEGGYRSDMAWWSEGLAEYLGTFYEEKYQSLITANEAQKYTLAEIFAGESNAYSWGELAVGFLIETQAETVTQMLSLMRAGVDCNVGLPAAQELKQATEPYLPHWPAKGTLGTCSLAETYRTSYTNAADVAITNTTDTPVKVYWLSTSQADKAGGSYTTLAQGESFTPDNWRVNERVMLTDIGDNCLGVAILNDSDNQFEILAEHVVGAVEEIIIPQATAVMGSCDLAVPYTRESGNAPEFIVANTSDMQYSLYWIDTDSGQPYLDNVYATLNLNEMYSADFWTVGDRMMVTDSDDVCVGVLDLNETSNIFVLE